jgi:hypothetical protein
VKHEAETTGGTDNKKMEHQPESTH